MMKSRRAPAFILGASSFAGIVACGPSVNPPTTTTATTTTSNATSGTASATAGEDPDPTVNVSTTSGVGPGTGPVDSGDASETTQAHLFLMSPDGGSPSPAECDSFAQDCPEGDKCVPWNAEGDNSFSGTKCVPVGGDGAPGDPCTTPEGQLAGIDDCAFGSFCWGVDRSNVGTCFAQCSGSADDPSCPPNFTCKVGQLFYINLCFPS